MSRHDDTVYLRHILEHARTAMALSAGKDRSSLDSEPMLRYSLLHLVCILGEAANRISETGRSKHGQIVWKNPIGMRNMVIHGYDAVDLDILWKTVETDLPALIQTLQQIIPEECGHDHA